MPKQPSDVSSPELQSFRLSILNHMEAKGIEHKELARRMGVGSPMITKILDRNHNLTFSTANRLATAVGLQFVPSLKKPGP